VREQRERIISRNDGPTPGITFSKVSSELIVHSDLSGVLAFENFYERLISQNEGPTVVIHSLKSSLEWVYTQKR